ncbi:cellulose binding domain-containing protein [Waterburya agarophytonicola K14]|uniref:Cellulose binding domain-containing protein n=1 Tax=Waterburya agarophytonicola KI4 TaxID=2874699 RepID=A0A964BNM6_9CYAN|nr:expansin EXLX1 family cellulose-binding protein [Waterburya agarophytonicola]MCC0175472.1 cellulose binding domain-containing protein [Waterburya agarophytonicola KI4]
MQTSNNNLIRTEFSVKTEWEQGFSARLDIFNEGEIVEDWTIEFQSEFEIKPGEIWGAEIVSQEGDLYILKPVDYNETIDSQQGTSIFFNANKVNGEILSPTSIVLNDDSSAIKQTIIEPVEEEVVEQTVIEPIEEEVVEQTIDSSITETTTEEEIEADVNFTLVKNWDSGFEGKISITNNTGGNLDSWSLEFDFPNQINNIWDAEIEENADGSYVITHAAWNREIVAGETLTFGFTGNNSVTSEPQNFDLDGSVFNSASRSDSIYTYSNDDLESELELGREYQGRATFYDAANPAGGLGASGYDVPMQSELHKVVAINNIQWNGSEASGGFFEVSGPKQRDGAAPITVQVVDYLYERADGFDMSAEAFEKVADPIDGVVNIEYKLIAPGDDYVTAYGYSIGQGIVVEGIDQTNPYYAAVRLNNHRYPIESVDLITNGGNLVQLERESDNRFVLEGNYPLYGGQDLVVTDIFGQQVTLDDIDITNGSSADIVTGEQFELV